MGWGAATIDFGSAQREIVRSLHVVCSCCEAITACRRASQWQLALQVLADIAGAKVARLRRNAVVQVSGFFGGRRRVTIRRVLYNKVSVGMRV